MKVTEYEKTYTSVKDALNATQHLATVVEFLRQQNAPVTCKEIGRAVFGGAYDHSFLSKSYSAQMGQILRHLRKGGFIKIEERKGDPIEIEVAEYVNRDENGNPATIKVHDDEGNEYEIPNPKYRPSYWNNGRFEKVKKTVTPTIKTYLWVA